MKFCANCGSPVQNSSAPVVEQVQPAPEAAAPVVEQVQPAPEAAAPAVEQVQSAPEAAAPAVEQVQSAVEAAAPVVEQVQPAPEAAAPVAEQVQSAPEAAFPAVEQVQSAPEAAAPAVEQVQPVQQQNAPIEPLQPEQSVQEIAPAPYINPAMPAAPVQPVQPAAPVQPVKKKKSKAPLIAGVTAGAVLVGGGAAGYFFFHDDITRLFMGNAGYAKMIDENYLRSAIDVDPSAELYAGYLAKTIDSTLYSLKTTSASSRAAENADASADSTAEVFSETTKKALGLSEPTWLYSVFDFIPEGTTLSMEESLDVQLGSILSIFDADTANAIVSAVNSFTLTGKLGNGEADLMSFGIKDKDGHSGSVELYTKDGGILISFPGVSDKTFYISKDEFDQARNEAEFLETDRVKLDPKELDRIRAEIVKIYYNSYDTAEITYTGNTEWTENAAGSAGELTASAKGCNVHVVLTSEQVRTMLTDMVAFVKNDEYLTSYFTQFLNITPEQYSEMIKPEEYTKNIDFSLTVDHIVDKHNNVLATAYTVTGGNSGGKSGGEITFRNIKTDSSNAAVFSFRSADNKEFAVKCVGQNTTKTDGNAVLSIVPDTSKDVTLDIDCIYTGVEKKKFLDRDVLVGRFEIKLSDPDKFVNGLTQAFGKSSSQSAVTEGGGSTNSDYVLKTMSEVQTPKDLDSEALFNELKKTSITLESKLEGDVLSTSFRLSFGEIGSFGVNTSLEKKNENITMPDTTSACRIDDTEALSALGKDALNWLKGFAESLDGGSGYISQAINKTLGSLERDEKIKTHFAAYNSINKYDANNYSYEISNKLEDAMEQKGAENTKGVIKLYFDDGKAEILDDSGITGLKIEGLDYDSVYAQAYYDKRYGDGIIGVATVMTDDKNDLPSGLPEIDNFAQGFYPWENADNGFIGEYVVGAYPYLYTGEIDPAAVPAEPYTLEELNNYAKLIADALSDIKAGGPTGTAYAAFLSDSYNGWYDIGYEGMSETDDSLNKIKERLTKLSEDSSGMNHMHAAIYFADGKLAGVMTAESGTVYHYDTGVPKAADFAAGTFSGWVDGDGDGAADIGYVTPDSSGEIQIIGTYSVPSKGTLAAVSGSSAVTGSGRWVTTSIAGISYDELAEEYGVDPNDYILYLTPSDQNYYISSPGYEDSGFYMQYKDTEYYGTPAIGLIDEESGDVCAYIVVWSDTQAQLYDIVADIDYELTWEADTDAGNTSEDGFYGMLGKWTDGEKTYAVSSNGIISDITTLYQTKYYWNYYYDGVTRRLCKFGSNDELGFISYKADDDTFNISINNSYVVDTYKRVEKAPTLDYTDLWTVDTYDGEAVTGRTLFDIGEYSAHYSNNPGNFEDNTDTVYDVIDTTATTFKIVFDSSYFLDCTYDKASDTISAVMMFDDSSDTIPLTMKRTPDAMG
jgi:hypothetical protein